MALYEFLGEFHLAGDERQSISLIADGGSALAALNGIPQIDFPINLRAAVAAGRWLRKKTRFGVHVYATDVWLN